MKKTHHSQRSIFVIFSIIFLAACMRTPITSIPPILSKIATGLSLNVASLGILTTIPLICFALFSPIASTLGIKLGTYRSILCALLLLIFGTVIRVFSFNSLILGTILVGIGIATINVLMPVVISERFPTKLGTMTSLYTVGMVLFSSAGAGFSEPIAAASNWQTVLLCLGIFAVIALIFWSLSKPTKHPVSSHQSATEPSQSVWSSPIAWALTIFMGLQSLCFYTMVAWLPSMAQSVGISQANAGILASIFQLASVPTAYLFPYMAVKAKNSRGLILVATSGMALGLIGLLLPLTSFWYYLLLNLILGAASSALFSLNMTLLNLKTERATQTTSLSGMVQSFGYGIAAIGPVFAGWLQATTHSWNSVVFSLLGVVVLTIITGLIAESKQYIFPPTEKKLSK